MSTETGQINNVPPMERVGSILTIESASPLQYLENCLSLMPFSPAPIRLRRGEVNGMKAISPETRRELSDVTRSETNDQPDSA